MPSNFNLLLLTTAVLHSSLDFLFGMFCCWLLGVGCWRDFSSLLFSAEDEGVEGTCTTPLFLHAAGAKERDRGIGLFRVRWMVERTGV